MQFQKKRLALVTASLLATTLVTGCDWWSDDDSTPTQQEVVLPPTEVVDEISLTVPSEPTAPAAGNVVFSYLVDDAPAPAQRELVAPVTFAAWRLVASDCNDVAIGDELAPTSEDEFGPVWSVPVAEATCLNLVVKDGTGATVETLSGIELEEFNGIVVKADGVDGFFTSRGAAFGEKTGITPVSTVSLPDPVPLPEAVDTAPEGKAVIQFVDPEGEFAPYDGFSLYIWNDGCSPAAASADVVKGWGDETVKPAGSDEYGPYWEVPLAATSGCFNFIVRKSVSPEVKLTGDVKFDLAVHTDRIAAIANMRAIQADRTAAGGTLYGNGVSGASAHMIDGQTLAWASSMAGEAAKVQVFYAKDGGIDTSEEGTISATGITLEPVALSDEQKQRFPHLASAHGFKFPTFPEGVDVETLLKGELIAIASNDEGKLLEATQIQIAGALDAVFAVDAKDETLGAILGEDGTTFRLWAPTAKSVHVKFYDANKNAVSALALDYDEDSGIWSTTSDEAEFGTYYRYVVKVFHPVSREVEEYEVTDPYSLSLSTNSEFSQVVDLNDPSLKPAGWDQVTRPQHDDVVVYQSHIRDFSVMDETVDADKRGKYLAFTDTDSVPMQHLQKLKEAGLTHFQLLPAFDFATVNEDPAKRVDITDTVAKLCELSASAAVCSDANVSKSALIKDVLAGYDPASSAAQALMASVRGLDSFNWGYDPFHFGAPEGSYSSNPDGTTRILEFREMVKALHTMGLGVVMDVVYNHTNASGPDSDKSVLDKIVPWYYHRLGIQSGAVEKSTCCENTATENTMMAKLMIDTLAIWTEAYKIDSFRFDLMGFQPLAAMEEALAVTKAINPNMYFYGEGWNYGEVKDDARFEQATQLNLAGTGIGSFSDRLRDAVRGGSPFDGADFLRKNQGFANGVYNDPNDQNSGQGVNVEALKATAMSQADQIMVELSGNLADYVLVNKDGDVVTGKDVNYNGQPSGYTQSPKEVITYVSKHDNQTLWDINQYKLPADMTSAERAKAQVFALSFPAFGQGHAFIHMGSDLLRSKSMERDSYDSGDWYNLVDFTGQTNNWNVGLPREDKDGSNWDLIKTIIANEETKPTPDDIEFAASAFQELLSIRAESKLFRLGTKEAVMKRVDFHNVGPDQTPGVIVMSIDDGVSAGDDLDASKDAVVVVFNGSDEPYTKDLGVAGLVLHDNHVVSAEATVTGSTITVPGYTTAVFVLPQDGEQGAGIPVAEKVIGDLPTFGDVAVLLRGDMNGWGADDALTYVGGGIYSISFEITEAKSYNFKFADADWGVQGVDVGFGAISEAEGSLSLSAAGADISVTIPAVGMYDFVLNAADRDAMEVKVSAAVE